VLFGAADYTSQNERSVLGIEQLRRHLDAVQSELKQSYSNETRQHWANMSSKTSPQHLDSIDVSAPNIMENLVSHETTHRYEPQDALLMT
jgi:hypothetical protein